MSLGGRWLKLIIGILFLLSFMKAEAQDTLNTAKDQPFKTRKVQWVSQFPSVVKNKKAVKKGWFLRLIFGSKNNPELIKPVAIFASSPEAFSVLDQGSATIFQVKNYQKKVPKALRKHKFNFSSLVNFCKFSNNEILFSDSRSNKIFKFNEEQNKLDIFNIDFQLQQPTGIAYSTISNEIWIVETSAHRISVLNEQGKLLKTLGKRGTAPGEFNFPSAICIDTSGNAYVIDAMNFRIQVFNKAGEVISVFGEPGNATGYFARPKGIATDPEGNIYITDALYHTVQVFDIKGNFLYHFGKQGRGKDQFWMPFGIYIDENYYIYVADSYNARIQIFQLLEGI